MKIRCYPKYSYGLFFCLSIVMLAFSIAPLIIKTDDGIIVKIFWGLFMAIMSVISMIGAVYQMQYFYIDDNYIVLKSAFGTIMKLDALNIHISIESLPTYFHGGYASHKKWICIYDNSLRYDTSSKFLSGCSNNKKVKRIQIIYSEKNIKIIRQCIRDSRKRLKDSKQFLYDFQYRLIFPIYDASGIIGAVQTYNTTTETFYFDRNIKGDVIGIYNASGTQIAKYSYDAWGNQKITTYSSNNFSGYNPIRYRGYYFDAESGFYFLNARYYNPTWRRFISPDNTAYLDPNTPSGLNLYAYCNNDPVNYADPSGCSPTEWWEWVLAAGITVGLGVAAFFASGMLGAVLVGATLGALSSLVVQGISGELNWKIFFFDIGVGAFNGFVGNSKIPKGACVALGGLSGAFFNFLAQWITLEEGGSISFSQIILSGIVGALISYFSGAGANNKEALMADDNVMAATKKLKKVDYRIKNGTRYSSPEAAQFAKKNAEVLLSKTISTYKRASFESSMILYAISTFSLGLVTSSDEADWVF